MQQGAEHLARSQDSVDVREEAGRGDKSVVPESKSGASVQRCTLALESGTRIKPWLRPNSLVTLKSVSLVPVPLSIQRVG